MPLTMALPPPEPMTGAERTCALACAALGRLLASRTLTRHPAWGHRALPRLVAAAGRGAARPATNAEASRAVGIVATASPRLGGATACLPRSLAALLYCRTRGLTATVVVGMHHGTATSARPLAHAWLEADSRPAGEPADPTAQFTALDRYTTAPPTRTAPNRAPAAADRETMP